MRQSVREWAVSAAIANLHAIKPELNLAAQPLKACTAHSMFHAAGQNSAHIYIIEMPDLC